MSPASCQDKCQIYDAHHRSNHFSFLELHILCIGTWALSYVLRLTSLQLSHTYLRPDLDKADATSHWMVFRSDSGPVQRETGREHNWVSAETDESLKQ